MHLRESVTSEVPMSRAVRDSSQCTGRSNKHTEDLSEYNAVVMWFWIVVLCCKNNKKLLLKT